MISNTVWINNGLLVSDYVSNSCKDIALIVLTNDVLVTSDPLIIKLNERYIVTSTTTTATNYFSQIKNTTGT